MQVQALGHVVLKVRNLKRSEDFYSGVLGMQVVLRISEPPMTFLTVQGSDNHHDFALMELGSDAPAPGGDATGLAHVAFKVGNSSEEFDCVRYMLDQSRIPVLYEAQRAFSRSVHMLDPDGNEVELYVDVAPN